MAQSQWIADRASGRFLYGGFYDPTFDPETQVLVRFDEGAQPDQARDRYDAELGKRPATADEIAAATAALIDEEVNDNNTVVKIRSLKAGLMSLFAQITGRMPTTDEVTAMTERAKTIYQSL